MKEDKIASILKNFLVSVTYVLTTKNNDAIISICVMCYNICYTIE